MNDFEKRAEENRRKLMIRATAASAVFVALCIVLAWCWPQYRIYSQTLRGEAALREAESSRQIAVLEAKAILESAKFKSDAEVQRARGVAEANKIIGDSLKGNDAYLRYLWIENLNSGVGERIYIPTEAGLPILEARPRETRN